MKGGGVVRAVGWVRVRLLGAVSGRRLTALSQAMPLRGVRTVHGGLELDVRAGDLNAVRHVLRGSGAVSYTHLTLPTRIVV